MSEMLSKSRSNRAAFFDLDLTITDRDSLRLFLKVYYLKNIFRSIYIPYVFFFCNFAQTQADIPETI